MIVEPKTKVINVEYQSEVKEDSINKVRLRSSLVDVIGEYLELKKKGPNFFGCCPFHQEKTPSFSVNEECVIALDDLM